MRDRESSQRLGFWICKRTKREGERCGQDESRSSRGDTDPEVQVTSYLAVMVVMVGMVVMVCTL